MQSKETTNSASSHKKDQTFGRGGGIQYADSTTKHCIEINLETGVGNRSGGQNSGGRGCGRGGREG